MSGEHRHDESNESQHASDEDAYGEVFWDQRYASEPAIWSGHPNPQLVAEATSLSPGRALDAGCGEGADAIWLATRGWHVTAVDISTVALERGAAQSRKVGADVADRINWQQADIRTWEPEPQAYELVSVQFMQMPAPMRGPFYSKLSTGVSSGGTLLVVGHSPADLQTTAHRPPCPERFFTAGDIASILDPTLWRIDVTESRAREALDPDGNRITVHDEVLAASRV